MKIPLFLAQMYNIMEDMESKLLTGHVTQLFSKFPAQWKSRKAVLDGEGNKAN